MRFASWHVRTLSTEILRSLTESGQIETDAPRGVGAEIEQELLDHLAQEEALGPEDVSELASKRFDALLDGLVALLGECESVEIFGDDSELRRTIASVFPAVLGGGLPSADRGAADGAHEELGRLRSVGVEPPSVVLDDGTRVTVSYEILDACRAHHGDRVRVRRSYGEVTSLAPLLAVAAAVATLSRFAVVDLDAGDLDPESPWPVTLFETAWNHRGDDGVVALDHDEFTVETVSDWLRRSGVDDPKITPGPPDRFDHGSTLVIDVGNGPRPPLRPVPHELGPEINRILGERNSPWRWYELHSFDSRSVFLRLDRAPTHATPLGHAFPQIPQLFESVSGSDSQPSSGTPLQSECPSWQKGWQVPFTQAASKKRPEGPVRHLFPHAPQWSTSFAVFVEHAYGGMAPNESHVANGAGHSVDTQSPGASTSPESPLLELPPSPASVSMKPGFVTPASSGTPPPKTTSESLLEHAKIVARTVEPAMTKAVRRPLGRWLRFHGWDTEGSLSKGRERAGGRRRRLAGSGKNEEICGYGADTADRTRWLYGEFG